MSRLEEIALEYGLCNCDEAYIKRNLTAPDCPFHAFAVSEAMEQYAIECCIATLKKAGDVTENLMLSDKIDDIYIEDFNAINESITNPDNITLL